MTSFLKGLVRGNQSKHKKLLEDWTATGKDVEGDPPKSSEGDAVETNVGASFSVKYMGSSLVDSPNGKMVTAEAIKMIIAMSKASGKKLRRVIVSVSLRGIKIVETSTNETQFDISIYRISYCSADAAFNRVFAFIATNENETMECHAFLCRKRKLAQNATLAIARTFNTAYELWQISQAVAPADDPPNDEPEPSNIKIDLNEEMEQEVADKKADTNPDEESAIIIDENHPLIDFTKEIDLPKHEKSWVLFDEDEGDLPKKIFKSGSSAENEIDAIGWGGNDDSIDLLSLP